MNREEQIAEMAKIVDEMYNVYTTTADDIAEGLYNAGYRKEQETAKEIERLKVENDKYAELVPNYIAEIYLLQQRYSTAAEEARRYLSAHGDRATDRQQAEMSRVLGTTAYREGKYDEAVLDVMGLKWNDDKSGVVNK